MEILMECFPKIYPVYQRQSSSDKGGGRFGWTLGGCWRILPWLPCWLAQVIPVTHEYDVGITFDATVSIIHHHQPILDLLMASFNP